MKRSIAILAGFLLLPGVVRTDARTVAFSTNDCVEGFKLMRAMIALGSGR